MKSALHRCYSCRPLLFSFSLRFTFGGYAERYMYRADNLRPRRAVIYAAAAHGGLPLLFRLFSRYRLYQSLYLHTNLICETKP